MPISIHQGKKTEESSVTNHKKILLCISPKAMSTYFKIIFKWDNAIDSSQDSTNLL